MLSKLASSGSRVEADRAGDSLIRWCLWRATAMVMELSVRSDSGRSLPTEATTEFADNYRHPLKKARAFNWESIAALRQRATGGHGRQHLHLQAERCRNPPNLPGHRGPPSGAPSRGSSQEQRATMTGPRSRSGRCSRGAIGRDAKRGSKSISGVLPLPLMCVVFLNKVP